MPNKVFQSLEFDDQSNNYTITHKKTPKFKKLRKESIEKCFDFAWGMTFGKEGEHRDHRTGGSKKRRNGEIFINTFQGKLAELGIYNVFSSVKKKLERPDFNFYGLGEWDDVDIEYDDKFFSIKSTKFYGNLLLLESKDWDDNGRYIPNKGIAHEQYDFFVLVRISPDGESIMKRNKLLYCDGLEKEELKKIIISETWKYDIVGYITGNHLIEIIKNKLILPKGSTLNQKTKMDAENYYVQAGDLLDFEELLKSL